MNVSISHVSQDLVIVETTDGRQILPNEENDFSIYDRLIFREFRPGYLHEKGLDMVMGLSEVGGTSMRIIVIFLQTIHFKTSNFCTPSLSHDPKCWENKVYDANIRGMNAFDGNCKLP